MDNYQNIEDQKVDENIQQQPQENENIEKQVTNDESNVNNNSNNNNTSEDEKKENENENGANSTTNSQNNETEQPGKDQKTEEGKIFVGGLNIKTTDDNLRNYFSQFGEISECVIMRTDIGESRCFGFITFKEPSIVDGILKQTHTLDGKTIDPKRAIPREDQDKTEKIFVGGVKPEVTEDEFREYFSKYGTVVESTLMVNKETHKPRGFGFIKFDNDQSVEAVLADQGNIVIRDKQVEVKRALPKNKTQKINHNRRNNYPMDQRRSYAGPIRNNRGMNEARYSRGGYNNQMMNYGRDGYGNRSGNRGGYYGYGNGGYNNGYGYDNMNVYYRGGSHGNGQSGGNSQGYGNFGGYNTGGRYGGGYNNPGYSSSYSRAADAAGSGGYSSGGYNGYGNSGRVGMNQGGYGGASNAPGSQASQSRNSHSYHPYAH